MIIEKARAPLLRNPPRTRLGPAPLRGSPRMVPFLTPIGPISFKRSSSRHIAQHTSDGPARNRIKPNDDLDDGDMCRGDIPPKGTTGIFPCRRSHRGPTHSLLLSTPRAAAAANFASGPVSSSLSPVGSPSPIYADIRCDENNTNSNETNDTDIGSAMEDPDNRQTNATVADPNNNTNTRPASCLHNVLQRHNFSAALSLIYCGGCAVLALGRSVGEGIVVVYRATASCALVAPNSFPFKRSVSWPCTPGPWYRPKGPTEGASGFVCL